MEPGDDIIDVLYRCGQSSVSTSPPPYKQVEGRPASEAVFSISPTTNKPNLAAGSKTSPGQHSQWLTGASTATPVLERYNGGTGRIGYNNTPQVQRRASFTKSSRQPNSDFKSSPLPRSVSAYDSRTPPRHQRAVEGGDYDEQAVYVPRSTMVDIIYRQDDDMLDRRVQGEELIELPSGARQRRREILEPGMGDRDMAGQDGVRRRRHGDHRSEESEQGKEVKQSDEEQTGSENVIPSLLKAGNKIAGLLVMVFLSYHFSSYLYMLHENDMWFSEIMEVEREISFRTEQGLYYSYYKQLLNAPNLSSGLEQLQTDNLTESTNTINIMERFNIYQEVVLAALYKVYNFRLSPIFFYTYSVFFLQGVFLSALYILTWSLTGTWLAGVLTAVTITINRFDVTRVNFTVPLREHFSLPFMFWQFFAIGQYLKSERYISATYHLFLIFIPSLLFTLSWQFAQFVLLIQALVLFCLATVGLLHKDKVCHLLALDLCVMLSVWYLQFYQPMVITSLIVSLVPITILSLQSQADQTPVGVVRNIVLAIARIVIAVIITLCLNTILKLAMDQTADNHIFKFLINKLAKDSTDFETQLYLCNEAFKWLDYTTYIRLSSSLVLPPYTIFTLVYIFSCIMTLLNRWKGAEQGNSEGESSNKYTRSSSRAQLYQKKLEQEKEEKQNIEKSNTFLTSLSSRSDLCFHTGQAGALGVLAISTLRMKCFWSPYICVLASTAVADTSLWSTIARKISANHSHSVMSVVRNLFLLIVIFFLANNHKAKITEETEDLREFYDPDTVDLMQWIQQNTEQYDAISGSMQLMAGVKLCTGRPITNHPHFEDKNLRDRTRELYQMYAKTGPEEVFSILQKYNASYIVLEDSICLAHRERCTLPDIMDLSNGHIPDDGIKNPPTLVSSSFRRFCEEVRYDTAEYRRWFRKVFENKTFRIYKLLQQ